MTDIVERLRDYRGGDTLAWNAMEEAADEIERLRNALRQIADNEIVEFPTIDTIRDFAYAALEGK